MGPTLLMGQFSAVISNLKRVETYNKFLFPSQQLTTCLTSLEQTSKWAPDLNRVITFQ